MYFRASGLISAQGSNVAEHLQKFSQQQFNPPATVALDLADGELQLPYFRIDGARDIYQLCSCAIAEALTEAQLTEQELAQCGLFIGSTSFEIAAREAQIERSDKTQSDLAAAIPPFAGLAEFVRDKFSLAGPDFTFATACTSSANALIYAAELLRSGTIKHALVLGLEFYNRTTALGFHGLDLISQQGMRPFSTERDGLYLGEGCGALVLSAEKPAASNWRYLGGATLNDNHSITACNTDGSTIEQVIRAALVDADTQSKQIRWVKAHGTASLSNDEAESAGLARIFTTIPPITALKPLLGHTLGACGINELILFYRAIDAGLIPIPPDQAKTALDFDLKMIDRSAAITPGRYLLNYFAFGGSNTCLVIGND